jgi:hypothetical protein
MVGLTTESYVPILREKFGERQAFSSFSRGALDHTRPQWVVPSRSQKDLEEGRFLDAHEYVRLNGSRIGLVTARRPCFVDIRFALAGFPDGEIGQSVVTLFRTIREATALPAPVLDLTSSDSTQVQAVATVLRSQRFGLGLRLNAEAMQDASTPVRVRTLLQLTDTRPAETTILLDFEDAELADDDDMAALVEEAYDRISIGFDWQAVVFQATSYPENNPARKNDIATPLRSEFSLWRRLASRSKRSGRSIVFGDYGADNAAFHFDGQGRPSPHLRYSTESSWNVSRGDKKADRRQTMMATAGRIVARPDFSGDGYSWGDSMIVDIAAGDRVGNPTTWRAINTSHHIERTCREIGSVLGFVLPEYSRVRRGVQTSMDV